jgi:hypothetical protein
MIKSRFSLVILLFVPIFWGYVPSMAETMESQAASVLFNRYETVFRSPADLLVGSAARRGLSQQDVNALRVPFAYLLAALGSLGKNHSAEVLARSEQALVGTRDYEAPKGLGSVRSQFCYVLILKESNRLDLRQYFSGATEVSSSVWNWSAKLGEFGEGDPRPSSLYATQIASYLLVSNNRHDLEAATLELSSPQKAYSPLQKIREWKVVSQHDYWGYRHYRHTGDVQAAGTEDVTRAAEAIIFFVDFKEKVGLLRLLSTQANDSTVRKMAAANILPPFKLLRTRMRQTSIPFISDKKTSEQMFYVMGLFGFGIYA